MEYCAKLIIVFIFVMYYSDEHFLELGNLKGYYSLSEENYFCHYKAIISIHFQCNKLVLQDFVLLPSHPHMCLISADLRLMKSHVAFVCAENIQISF